MFRANGRVVQGGGLKPHYLRMRRFEPCFAHAITHNNKMHNALHFIIAFNPMHSNSCIRPLIIIYHFFFAYGNFVRKWLIVAKKRAQRASNEVRQLFVFNVRVHEVDVVRLKRFFGDVNDFFNDKHGRQLLVPFIRGY